MFGGYLRDPDDERDKLFSWSQRPFKSVETKREVNLWLPQMQIVQQRGNSCTGMAGAYAVRAALAHCNDVDPGELSGMFLYYTGRAVWGGEEKDEGSFLRTLFKALEVQGVCREKFFPHEISPLSRPSWSAAKDGFKHRGIKNYRQITTPQEAREALSEGIPLVGGWEVGEDFSNWSGGDAFKLETQYRGGHALAVFGYNSKGEYLIPNTWGTAGGEQGWWRVDEEFLMSNLVLFACDTRSTT